MTGLTSTPDRMGRNSAIAILGGVLVILALIAVAPHFWGLNISHQIADKTASAQQLEREAKQLGRAKQRLQLLSDPKIADLMLLKGSTAGLNGAQLQKQVAGIAARAGINPHSLRVSDPQNWKAGLRNITLEIGMLASVKQLQTFLFDVETSLPLLFIENLSATLPEAERSSGPGDATLDITIIVRGVAMADNT